MDARARAVSRIPLVGEILVGHDLHDCVEADPGRPMVIDLHDSNERVGAFEDFRQVGFVVQRERPVRRLDVRGHRAGSLTHHGLLAGRAGRRS